MDVNGTPVHMINGRADWHNVLGDSRGVEWGSESLSVRLQQVPQRFEQRGGVVHTPSDMRGADCDSFGHFYWIADDQRGVSVLSTGAQTAGTYWSVDDLQREHDGDGSLFKPAQPAVATYPDLRLAGLAVTTRNYLLVGTVQPGGLLIFDLHAGGSPGFSVWPEELAFTPFALSADPTGGVWLLDRGTSAQDPRVWRLDAYLRPADIEWTETSVTTDLVICSDMGGGGADERAYVLETAPGFPLPGLLPHALAAVTDDSFLLLVSEPATSHSSLVYVRNGTRAALPLDESLLNRSPAEMFSIAGHAIAFVPEADEGVATVSGRVGGRLYVAGVDGNQAFALDLQMESPVFELTLVPDFWPMRNFGGKNLVAHAGQAHYDSGGQWIHLVAHPRRRFVAGATVGGIRFDSGVPDCVWHRILLDACIPGGVDVTVMARTAEREEELALQPFSAQPAPYLRGIGSEVAFHEPFPGATGEGTGTWETLFQDATGRWIELEIHIEAGGRVTPRFHGLRVYAPRFSYLRQYLPDVFQQDTPSAAFLDRFLANTEGLFTSMEEMIANAEGLFDPRISTPDYLDWLAGWFDTCLDADWEDWRRRLFIRYAETLYRWRGTLPGLTAMLSVAMDECVDEDLLQRLRSGGPFSQFEGVAGFNTRIVERYLLRLFGGLALGDPTADVAPGVVGVDESWDPSQGAERLHAAWRAFLEIRRGMPVAPNVVLSPLLPVDAAQAEEWREFLDGQAFTYPSITRDATDSYRLFLSQRYLTVDALNAAYGWAGNDALSGFDDVALPGEGDFPDAGARLVDWMTFATLALPISANAHRFSVLVPAVPGEPETTRQLRMDKVAALIEREKPAHTEFDVQPFWALFQVGTARVGLDTILGEGSRYTAIQLGVTGMSEGTLAFGHPWNVADRAIAGRDRVSEIRL